MKPLALVPALFAANVISAQTIVCPPTCAKGMFELPLDGKPKRA